MLGDRLLTSPDNWNFSSVVLFPDLLIPHKCVWESTSCVPGCYVTVTSHIMGLFQMGQIWHLLGMKSPAAERSVMVFTQQHKLLLTQVF